MLRVSGGATDSSVEASVTGWSEAVAVVWEMAWTNSAMRMSL